MAFAEKMTAIEKIQRKMQKYPAARYFVRGDTITVEASDQHGFSVWLTDKKPGFTVGYDGWQEEFDDEDDALAAFAFGLSEDCRLKVIRRGNTYCSWTVEGIDANGQWQGDSTTGLLLTPFWRRRITEYRQNHILTNSEQADAGNRRSAGA